MEIIGTGPQGAETVDIVEPIDSEISDDPEGIALESQSAGAEMRSVVVTEAEQGQRLDKALAGLAPEFSRSHVQQLIEKGHATVNGEAVAQPSARLRIGQRVEIVLVPTAISLAFRTEQLPLDIVFEDAHLMVLNKPAGWVVHPAPGNWSGTVMNGVLAHHPGAFDLPRAGIVHRLDKDTSGLMVVGKTLHAVTSLVRALAARAVSREYLAIAHGMLSSPEKVIDAPLGRDPRSRVRMAIVASGKHARTDVYRMAASPHHSALRCRLHTGRTHQIRVHLASIGHPLVSDMVYGGKLDLGLARQALHATRLAFDHPVSSQKMVFEAVAPADFDAAWQTVLLTSSG